MMFKLYLEYINYSEQYEKIIEQIGQLLIINNIEYSIDDDGDIEFIYNNKLYCISIYNTRYYGINVLNSGWYNNISTDFDKIRELFNLIIPDDVLEKFIYELL